MPHRPYDRDPRSLEILRGLDSSSGPNNPSLQLAAHQSNRRDELRRKLSHSAGRSLDEIKDLAKMLEFQEEDIEESPLTKQRHEIEDIEKRGKEAQLQGFGRDYGDGGYGGAIEEQGRAAQAAERYKIDAPVRAAGAKAAGDLAIEQAKAKATQDAYNRATGSGSPQPGQRQRPPKVTTNIGPNGVSTNIGPPDELNAIAERNVVDLSNATRQTQKVRELIHQYREAQHAADAPGDIYSDDSAASHGSGVGSFFSQLGDVTKSMGKRKLYEAGFPDPTLSGDSKQADLYNQITQLTELSKVQATAGMASASRNMLWLKQLQEHVSRGNMPTATQLSRLDKMLEEYPQMIDQIYATHEGRGIVPEQSPPQASPPTGSQYEEVNGKRYRRR